MVLFFFFPYFKYTEDLGIFSVLLIYYSKSEAGIFY